MDCNSHFSNLERTYGRNSFEAIFRLRHQQRDLSDFEGFDKSRLSFRLPAGTPGAGVIVVPCLSPDGQELILKLPPQVGVQRDRGGEFRYYALEDLEREGAAILGTGRKMNLRLLAAKEDEAGLNHLRDLVRRLLPKYQEGGDLDLPPPERIDGQIVVEVRGTIDKLIARVVAKIAFNYMTKHTGQDFALSPSFDPIRQFIRYDDGNGDWRQFVRIVNEHLLAEETEKVIVTRGHLLIMGWYNFDTFHVMVSPYNSMVYEVSLTTAFDGIWRPIQCGHLFDWENRAIQPLRAVSKSLVPVGAANREAKAYSAFVKRRWDT